MLVDEHEEGAYGSFLELPGVNVGLRSIRSQTQTESPSPAYSLKSVDRGFILPQSSRARTYGPKGLKAISGWREVARITGSSTPRPDEAKAENPPPPDAPICPPSCLPIRTAGKGRSIFGFGLASRCGLEPRSSF